MIVHITKFGTKISHFGKIPGQNKMRVLEFSCMFDIASIHEAGLISSMSWLVHKLKELAR